MNNEYDNNLNNPLTINEQVDKEANELIQKNKDILIKYLIICSFIHNTCMSLITVSEDDDYYSQRWPVIQAFGIYFETPLCFILPILFGYARDFVNQVASIKISIILLYFGIVFNFIFSQFMHIQLYLVSNLLQFTGTVIFEIASFALIYDYYPSYQDFGQKNCDFYTYGVYLPLFLDFFRYWMIDYYGQLRGFLNSYYVILIMIAVSLITELILISRVLNKQSQLEETYEINIRDYRNPFRKNNLITTLKKYLGDQMFMMTLISVSFGMCFYSNYFLSPINEGLIEGLRDTFSNQIFYFLCSRNIN